MTSDAQRAANRRNALLSPGPASPAARDRVRRNALRHGLASAETMVLPDEDAEAFEALRQGALAELAPEGLIEAELAERVVGLLWRLARAGRVETALFRRGWAEPERPPGGDPLYLALRDGLAETARRVGATLPDATEDAAPEPAGPPVDPERTALARAFTRSTFTEPEGFAKLSRYEGALQRALARSLDSLWQVQRRRATVEDTPSWHDAA